ncbi:MAG: ISNCY family transposase [Gammaproteobacteria bacterium]|nr:ISNCY family transposase [Gammaproteobacteria bacterium]
MLEFPDSSLATTRNYYARYEAISRFLDEHPEIVDAVHGDLAKTVKQRGRHHGPGRKCEYTSDTILRVLICQIVEAEDLRGIVIRIDDSVRLRQFVRIHEGRMIDFGALCRFKNAISPETWKKVNRLTAEAAVQSGAITGDRLRLDTTAFETNIGYPSDSGLLWDTYRVLARNLDAARNVDPELLEGRRLEVKRAKKLSLSITRKSAKKGNKSDALVSLYKPLVSLVEQICELSDSVRIGLIAGRKNDHYSWDDSCIAEYVIEQLEHYVDLGRSVIDQTQRRVFGREKVPATEKLYSIFEPHTELLIRGKAGKPIEFGHMILIQQCGEKFITDYGVYETRPADHSLVDPALKSHEDLFGKMPSEFSGDKGFYKSTEKIDELELKIPTVSIGKKGKRNQRENERESSLAFKLAQAFRAGVEGSISFLKRALRMFRCFNKGWEHYVATVGSTIFAHNLLILARSG